MYLSLHAMTSEDLPTIESWFAETETKRRIGISDVPKWFDHVLNNEHYYVSIACKEMTPIGMVMLEMYDARTAAIAFMIAAEHRGHGYSRRMLQVALNEMVPKGVRVDASVEADNHRSMHCLESLGFVSTSSQPDEDNLFHFSWNHS